MSTKSPLYAPTPGLTIALITLQLSPPSALCVLDSQHVDCAPSACQGLTLPIYLQLGQILSPLKAMAHPATAALHTVQVLEERIASTHGLSLTSHSWFKSRSS